MSLTAEEFIRRFLMYILPSGLTKIRHYGFLSSHGKQKKVKICKAKIGKKPLKARLSTGQLIEKLIWRKPFHCPRCGWSGL